MARGRLVSTRALQGPCRASNLVVPGSRGSWIVSGPPYSWSNQAARNPGGGGSGAAYPMTNSGTFNSFPAAFRLIFFKSALLTGQRVLDVGRGGRDARAEGRVAGQDRLLHEPGDRAIGEVSLHARTQPGHVLRFRVIRLEQAAGAESERRQVGRGVSVGERQALDLLLDLVHDSPILGRDAGLLEKGGCLIAVDRRELLPGLLAAAVPVQVPPSAEVHEDVEDEAVAAPELLQEFVVRTAPPQRDFDQVRFLLLGPLPDHCQNLPVGVDGHAVQERRGQFVQRRVRFDQLNRLTRLHRTQPQALGGSLLQVWVCLDEVVARLRMAGQRGSERLVGSRRWSVQLTPHVERRVGAGAFQVLANGAQLGHRQREQTADLFFQCPDADHLAHVRGRGEGQEVARDVEGPRVHRPVVGLWLHVVGPRSRAGQMVLDGRVRSEEHTSELQSRQYLVCRLLLEKKK